MQNDNKPKPKYKIHDSIKLKSGRKGMICSEPVWNDWCESMGVKPQWYYNYDYGLMRSEGSVLEQDIQGLNKDL